MARVRAFRIEEHERVTEPTAAEREMRRRQAAGLTSAAELKSSR
jgi:hypothetical protein